MKTPAQLRQEKFKTWQHRVQYSDGRYPIPEFRVTCPPHGDEFKVGVYNAGDEFYIAIPGIADCSRNILANEPAKATGWIKFCRILESNHTVCSYLGMEGSAYREHMLSAFYHAFKAAQEFDKQERKDRRERLAQEAK